MPPGEVGGDDVTDGDLPARHEAACRGLVADLGQSTTGLSLSGVAPSDLLTRTGFRVYPASTVSWYRTTGFPVRRSVTSILRICGGSCVLIPRPHFLQ